LKDYFLESLVQSRFVLFQRGVDLGFYGLMILCLKVACMGVA